MILCCSFTSHFFVPCNLPVFTYLHCEDTFCIQILPFFYTAFQNKIFGFLPVLLNISAQVTVSFLTCNHISDNQVLHSANDKYKLIFLVCPPARSPVSVGCSVWSLPSCWVFPALLSLSTALQLLLCASTCDALELSSITAQHLGSKKAF